MIDKIDCDAKNTKSICKIDFFDQAMLVINKNKNEIIIT
tara:strand:- start:51 stop:167 length:117 start_codon:yes stop_codon:yes gene_type:complete